jgi:uncharacterized protein involved in copper resistance
MMKKIVTAVALATTLSLANSYPVEMGAGYAPGDDSGDVVTVFGGLGLWGGVGARLEFTTNINEGDLFSKEDVTRLALFATYNLPLTSYMSLTPKMGVVKNDAEVNVGDVVDAVSGSSTEFAYGLELNYNYNESVAFYMGYTEYGNDFDFDRFDSGYMDSANFTFGLKVGL